MLSAEKSLEKNQTGTAQPLSVGWISSWNVKCGIATYSKFLLEHLDQRRFDFTILAAGADGLLAADDARVIRCWSDNKGDIGELLKLIRERRFDVVIIQFSFAFQALEHIEAIITLCGALGIRTVVMCHATRGADLNGDLISIAQVVECLRLADRVLVHSQADVGALHAAGLNNVQLFPHGYPAFASSSLEAARAAYGLPQGCRIVGSYGFLLPHKGIDKLIEATSLLKSRGCSTKLLLVNALYPNPVSLDQLKVVQRMIHELGLE